MAQPRSFWKKFLGHHGLRHRTRSANHERRKRPPLSLEPLEARQLLQPYIGIHVSRSPRAEAVLARGPIKALPAGTIPRRIRTRPGTTFTATPRCLEGRGTR